MKTHTLSHTLHSSNDTIRRGFPAWLHQLLRTHDSSAPLMLRLTLAAVMFPHGAQKLLGLFGGYGFSGTMEFFTSSMGIPWFLAFGVIMIEFFAPILLLLGAATRPAALSIGIVMFTAMLMAHVQYGFFMNWSGTQKGEGIEYFLLLFGIVFALLVSGGGRWSLDGKLASLRTLHVLKTSISRVV